MNVCEICGCNAKESFMDCRELKLFELFDAKDWTSVKSSDLGTLKRILYVQYIEHFTICLKFDMCDSYFSSVFSTFNFI